MIYSPGSHQIYISGDVLFDETFGTAIATTWYMHHDSLALHPVQSTIPTMETPIEETDAINSFPIIAEEGKIKPSAEENDIDDYDTSVPDLLHPDDDSSTSSSEHEDDENDFDIPDYDVEEDTSPQPLSDPSSQLRRSPCVQKPISHYAYHT